LYRVLVVKAVQISADLKAHAIWVLQLLGVAVAYYAGTQVSVLTIPLGLPVTSLWFSAGIGLACLFYLGVRIWPGIMVGSFMSNIDVVPPLEALLVATGNTLAPLCAYLVLRRVGFRLELDRVRDAVMLVVLGAFAGMMVSAWIGTTALVVAQVWAASAFVSVWAVWWSSDVLGVLAITPLLLAIPKYRQTIKNWSGWRWAELTGLIAVTTALVVLVSRDLGILFLAFPLIIVVALRFQLIGVAPCALIVSAAAIEMATNGDGPFGGRSLLSNVMLLQVFNGTFVLTGLLLAAVVTQWREARQDVEQTCMRLAEVVQRLQESLLPSTDQLLERAVDAARESSETEQPADGMSVPDDPWARGIGYRMGTFRTRRRRSAGS